MFAIRKLLFRGALWGGIAAILGMAGTIPDARGETLVEALSKAYNTNPRILGQRAAERATNEEVPQALSNWRPDIEITGSAGVRDIDSNTSRETQQPRSIGLTVRQNIWRGGRTVSDTRRAESEVAASLAELHGVQQTVLLDAVRAYMNVLRDTAVVDLNLANEARLRRQLQATRDRFTVGEVTRTDVAQAEARLASATASRIQAEGDLVTARENYRRTIGDAPADLETPNIQLDLPATYDGVQAIARERNPDVVQAQALATAAEYQARTIEGELLPSVALRGGITHDRELASRAARRDTAELIAELSVPLYQRGAVYSRLRAARETVNQRRQQLDDARRSAIETAASAWNRLLTARAAVNSFQTEVRANQIALEGVELEALVGSRTVLDVLDAEQELLDSQVNLVQSQRDETVARFEVLSAIGSLTARDLALPVELYDAEQAYQKVRNRWFGGGAADGGSP